MEDKNGNTIFIISTGVIRIEQHFAWSAFLHGQGFDKHQQESNIIRSDETDSTRTGFDLLVNGTCSNRTGVIRLSGYLSQ